MTSPVTVPSVEDRAGQLAALGWTGRDAAWIALVCLHSGVFTRSQWCYFWGTTHLTILVAVMLSPSVGNLSADFRIESWLARDIGNDPSTIDHRPFCTGVLLIRDPSAQTS